MTPRDKRMLGTILKCRYLTTSQITSLCGFKSLPTARRRLKTMNDLGYLRNFKISEHGENVFFITPTGFEQINDDPERVAPNIKEPRNKLFLQHHIETNDFMIKILTSKAGKEKGVKLKRFYPYYYCKPGQTTKYIEDRTPGGPHTPDATMFLVSPRNRGLFFLEIDRGTENQSTVAKMIRFYQEYMESGKFKRYNEPFKHSFEYFTVLIRTTSMARAKNIAKLVPEENDFSTYVWVGWGDDDPLTMPWTIPGYNQHLTLVS